MSSAAPYVVSIFQSFKASQWRCGYGSTFAKKYPIFISFGIMAVLDVKCGCLYFFTTPSDGYAFEIRDPLLFLFPLVYVGVAPYF